MEKFKLRIEKRKKNDGGGKWGSRRGRELIIWRRFDVCERRIHSNATKGRNDWNEEEEGRKGEQGEKNSRRDSMRDEKKTLNGRKNAINVGSHRWRTCDDVIDDPQLEKMKGKKRKGYRTWVFSFERTQFSKREKEEEFFDHFRWNTRKKYQVLKNFDVTF